MGWKLGRQIEAFTSLGRSLKRERRRSVGSKGVGGRPRMRLTFSRVVRSTCATIISWIIGIDINGGDMYRSISRICSTSRLLPLPPRSPLVDGDDGSQRAVRSFAPSCVVRIACRSRGTLCRSISRICGGEGRQTCHGRHIWHLSFRPSNCEDMEVACLLAARICRDAQDGRGQSHICVHVRHVRIGEEKEERGVRAPSLWINPSRRYIILLQKIRGRDHGHSIHLILKPCAVAKGGADGDGWLSIEAEIR